jgi:hypothetical protein
MIIYVIKDIEVIIVAKIGRESQMSSEEYMLIFGSNIYANPTYTIMFGEDEKIEDRIPLITLENTDNGLLLTTEIQDESGNPVAKIDINNFTQTAEKFDMQSKIESETGITIRKKENNTTIFSARITEEGYIALTGTYYVKGKKIEISDSDVKIDGESRQTIKGINVHGTFFVGVGEITITDDGLKFYNTDNEGNACNC